MMLTTGMLMFGKISVGVRTIASAPMIRMSMANTTKVYGRCNASLTIHIGLCPVFQVWMAVGSPSATQRCFRLPSDQLQNLLESARARLHVSVAFFDCELL